KAEQFIQLSEKNIPFKNSNVEVFNLETNYRSYSEIIEFNNELFKFLSGEFSEESYKNLYLHSTQKPNNKKGGYVNLSFIDPKNPSNEEETADELYLKTIV